MDLSYGPEYDEFRDEVKGWLAENWPLQGDEAKASFEEQQRIFIPRATEAGYLLRWVPRKYGGSSRSPTTSRPPSFARSSPGRALPRSRAASG